MIRAVLLLSMLGACVDGLAPSEVGAGRRVGIYPGPLAAVLPPMTDRDGNLYVVTGVPDGATSAPGIAHVGAARGGWSEGCSTGELIRGPARGWIGATSGRGWLWSDTALLELAVDGRCTPQLDRDPSTGSDLQFHAVAPFALETSSGIFTVAILSSVAEPELRVATIEIATGAIALGAALPGARVLGAGADRARGEAVFAIEDATGARVLFVEPHTHAIASVQITGAMEPARGEIEVAADGSFAAVLGDKAVLVGDRSGARIAGTDMATAIGIERDARDALWLIGTGSAGASVAALTSVGPATATPWDCAARIDDALAAGIVVIDETAGERTTSTWNARSALGDIALLSAHSAPSYAVDARAWLVADPPIDRGGISYSQLAVIPVGVSFP